MTGTTPRLHRGNNAASSGAKPNPCALHAGWIPTEAGGRLVVWGEEASGVGRPERPKHPFCLEPEALKGAMRRAWVRPARVPEPDLETADAWIALPSADGWPGPSLELQADLDESPSLPGSWAFWRVSALSLEEPSTLLKHLSPKDIADPRVIRIGHDLRFWAQLLAALQNAVRHHEYLPSIRATAPANSSVPGRRRKPRIELEAEWELTRAARRHPLITAAAGRRSTGSPRPLRRPCPTLAGHCAGTHPRAQAASPDRHRPDLWWSTSCKSSCRRSLGGR